MTSAQIEVEGFTLAAEITEGRLTSLPFALCLEYCNGRQDVWYFQRRPRAISAYAKQLAKLVTDENLQADELYQPYHLKSLAVVHLNEKGEPMVFARCPEVDQDRTDCTPQHDKAINYDPWRLLEKEGVSV